MILQFHEAARLLEFPGQPSTDVPKDVFWLAENAIRGSAYEEKFRGPFRLYPKEKTPILVKRAAQRLRRLPEWGLAIECPAPLTLGPKAGWGTYGWKYSHALPEAALALRASIIDTAETYGYGRVETELGKVLISVGREYRQDTVIATKFSSAHMSGPSVIKAAVRSKSRLGVIDLYQLHWPNPRVPWEETLGSMKKLVDDGVVKYVGLSNCSIDQLWLAQSILPEITSLQIRSAPEDQLGIEREVLPYCNAAKITVIGHSPLGQGADGKWAKTCIIDLKNIGVVPIPGTNNVHHLKENLR